MITRHGLVTRGIMVRIRGQDTQIWHAWRERGQHLEGGVGTDPVKGAGWHWHWHLLAFHHYGANILLGAGIRGTPYHLLSACTASANL